MSFFRAMKSVICKGHGFAIAGGSGVVRLSGISIMGDSADRPYADPRMGLGQHIRCPGFSRATPGGPGNAKGGRFARLL